MAIQPKIIKTVSDIESQVIVSTLLTAPTTKSGELETQLGQGGGDLVKEAREILERYRSPTWVSDMELIEMQTDLMRIQSIKFSLSEIYGRLFSYCDSLSDELKIARAKAAHQARLSQDSIQKASGTRVQMTVEDIKDLSCAKTSSLWVKREELKMLSDGVRNVYFALRDAAETLDRCLHRFWQNEREMAANS